MINVWKKLACLNAVVIFVKINYHFYKNYNFIFPLLKKISMQFVMVSTDNGIFVNNTYREILKLIGRLFPKFSLDFF